MSLSRSGTWRLGSDGVVNNSPMEETVSKFADYLLHNPTWGVFHQMLWDRNHEPDYETAVDATLLTGISDTERELIGIYNDERPHDSLGDMPPSEYLMKHNPENCNHNWR